MALSLQIPLTIIADGLVRGQSYSMLFNLGATFIFVAFIMVTLSTTSSMPNNKIKVPRKLRHFCCCTCHGVAGGGCGGWWSWRKKSKKKEGKSNKENSSELKNLLKGSDSDSDED